MHYSYEFQQNEWVTSMTTVDLDSRSTRSGRRQFVGVGTTCNRAEDLAARGGVSAHVLSCKDPLISTPADECGWIEMVDLRI
jgi:hypothetical protein